jgi:MFS superfamily sulfate permease-like transporter
LVVGSLSKTSAAVAAGARTQFANLLVVVFCFLTLVLLTPLFRGMPHPAFAAIVIGATAPAIYDGASRTERARSVG